jgi:hypothetical protein
MISNAKGRKLKMAEHDANAEARKRQAEAEEATKKRLADEKQARERAHAEQRDSPGTVKPTPTQQENDLAASGVHVTEHEPDGSPPDPGVSTPASTSMRQSEAKPAAASRGNYPTRTMQPAS